MTPDDTSTFAVLREVIAKDHGLAPETLHPETPLADLTIDSLALIELIFTLEDRFNVAADNIPAELPTLGSVADYIDTLRQQVAAAADAAAQSTPAG